MAALLIACFVVSAAPVRAQRITSAAFRPVSRASPNPTGRRGNIVLTVAGGRRATVVRDGRALEPVVVFPDRRTVAWREGAFFAPRPGERVFRGTSVVLWRDGKRLRRIVAQEQQTIERFVLASGGQQVAIRTRGFDRTVVHELYEVATGRLLRRFDASNQGGAVPDWAAALIVERPRGTIRP
jgi:hypothetical protein